MKPSEKGTASILGAPQHQALFVTSEMADFIKAGGLGDVAAALPRVLLKTYDVRVLIPGYFPVLKHRHIEIVGHTHAYAGLPACQIGLLKQEDGLNVYVVICPQLFEREGSPYISTLGMDWEDNAIRFATLSYVAACIAGGQAHMNWQPGLLHLNDWPCALAASYVKWLGFHTPTLLTIHNLAYQGLFSAHMKEQLGVPDAGMASLDFYGQFSFLKSGIVDASYINTVSMSYAHQITKPLHGCGLDDLLARRQQEGQLSGILNGIDASWDPKTDAHLRIHFSLNDHIGKIKNKQALRQEWHLPEQQGPIFAVVSRLVHQKGLDIICDVTPQLVEAGGQLIIMGGGEPDIEQTVRQLAWRYPQHVRAHIGFNESASRRIFAGSDFLLMPSRFEPCGLSQMYAQRFGSLPIAHATGGLMDTVDDGVTGFLFNQASANGLRQCLARALKTFVSPKLFQAMRQAAMLRPSGWDLAGNEYLNLYHQAIRSK